MPQRDVTCPDCGQLVRAEKGDLEFSWTFKPHDCVPTEEALITDLKPRTPREKRIRKAGYDAGYHAGFMRLHEKRRGSSCGDETRRLAELASNGVIPRSLYPDDK